MVNRMTSAIHNIIKVPGPEVSADIFQDHEEATYWIGEVASLGQLTLPEYYDALTRFRAETYLHLGFIATEAVDSQGRDIDIDEARSSNFAVVKQHRSDATASSYASLVGSGRLIHKGITGAPLPIEQFFPEVFAKAPISENSVEVSRFISKEQVNINRHLISLSIIRALAFSSADAGVDNGYCIIEKPLYRLLDMIGIPLKIMGEPKDIPSLGGILYPVEINPYRVLESAKTDKYKIIDLKKFFDDKGRGVGFYKDDLNGVKDE